MSGWVGKEEFEAIRRSWADSKSERAPWKAWTPADHVEACHQNLMALAQEERRLRELDRTLPIGDFARVGGWRDGAETPSLEYLLRRNAAEQRHWREYQTHYIRLAERGAPSRGDQQPRRDRWGEEATKRMNDATLFEDRRLPREREPGDDDVDFTVDEPGWRP